MGKVIVKSAVKRKPGTLYYVDGKGNVCEARMNRKGGKKGRHVCMKKKTSKRKKATGKKKR